MSLGVGVMLAEVIDSQTEEGWDSVGEKETGSMY
jgi:hypothetical protein